MPHEQVKIWLQGASVALLGLGLLASATFWAVGTLVAAEVAPLKEKIETLEKANERAADPAEEIRDGISQLQTQAAEITEALKWIKKALEKKRRPGLADNPKALPLARRHNRS